MKVNLIDIKENDTVLIHYISNKKFNERCNDMELKRLFDNMFKPNKWMLVTSVNEQVEDDFEFYIFRRG